MFILQGINGFRFNRDDDTKSNDENDNVEEVEIDAKMINEEACNVGISRIFWTFKCSVRNDFRFMLFKP
jgi:hypothetical protein